MLCHCHQTLHTWVDSAQIYVMCSLPRSFPDLIDIPLLCVLHAHKTSTFKIDGKYGVPNPVTASQPSVAGNPLVLHPAELPFVISVNALCPTEYSHGFMKPNGGRPAASNASLANPRTPAQMGVDPDVPTSPTVLPFHIVGNSCPTHEMSG